jgi:hypothetical protein
MNELATDPCRNKRNGQEIEVKFQTDPVGLERALSSGVLAAASAGQPYFCRGIDFGDNYIREICERTGSCFASGKRKMPLPC